MQKVAATGVTAFSMELMPRTTRAQSMDALSSMAHHLRLQSGAARRRHSAPHLSDADDRRRNHRSRRACWSSARESPDCRPSPPRAGWARGLRLRPPPGRQGTGGKPGRALRRTPDRRPRTQRMRAATPSAQDEEFLPAASANCWATWSPSRDVVITAAVIPGKKSPILITANGEEHGAGLGDRRSGSRARRQLRTHRSRRKP